MRTIVCVSVLTVSFLTVAACAEPDKLPEPAWAILEKAAQIEVYSLDPEEQKDPKGTMHGYKKLGSTTVKDAELRKELLGVLEKSLGKTGAKCFDPRHAISA